MFKLLLLIVFCTYSETHIPTCWAAAPACAKDDPASLGCTQHMALLQALCPAM